MAEFFSRFYGPRRSRGNKIKKKKRKRPISSHLDLTSLVNKRFMIQKKSFDTIRIKNDLFISIAGREVELCLYHKKLLRFV